MSEAALNQEPQGTPPTPPAGDPPEETVSKSAFDRMKEDLFKTKEKNRQLEESVKARETEQLKDQQKWKELAEIKEQEAREASEKYTKLNQAIIEEKKMTEIRKEAVKLGIRPQALDDLDLQNWSDVGIEATSTGRINVIGAAKAVERLKTIKPYLFDEPRAPGVNPGMPQAVPGQGGTPVTVKDIAAAEAEAKKTGDYSKYKELMVKFQLQKKS